jgi:hypothetical protein
MVYLLPGASLVLAPGIVLASGELYDIDGRSYPLNAVGAQVCALARVPIDIRTMCDRLSDYFDVDPSVVAEDVRRYVIDLHQRGFVAVNQSFLGEAYAAMILVAGWLTPRQFSQMIDVGKMRLFRRYAPTFSGLARSVVEAYQAVAWVGLVITAVAAGIAVAASPTRDVGLLGARALGISIPVLFLSFLSSIAVHEFGHLVAARMMRTLVFSTYVAAGLAGISYREPDRRRRMLIVVAGPISSIVFLLVLVAVVGLTPGTFWAATTFDQLRLSGIAALLSFAAFQLLAFTPITTDGRTLLKALRSGR